MKIPNIIPKINISNKAEFNREIISTNHSRSRRFSLLLIVISIVMIVSDQSFLQEGLENAAPELRTLFYLHLIVGISMLIFFCLSWLLSRLQSTAITWREKLFNLAFPFVLATICALFSVNDQLIDGKTTIYIMGVFALAIINYLSPLTSLLMYASSYIILILGITQTQTDSDVLMGHYFNSTILVIVAWFLSSTLYYAKAREYIDRKIIDAQKNQLEQTNVDLTAANHALRESLHALDESQNMIFTLALALESKDKYTRGHSERVAEYAVALAEHMGLSEKEKISLWRAAILHDTGKIGIPDAILNKSSGLTEEEWKVMRSHPERGETICSKLEFAKEILPIIRHHHERYDGTGYPDGLKGDEIPHLAKIVSIADMIDAITSQRPYRSAQTLETALQELEKHAKTQFDPVLARAFIDLYQEKTIEPMTINHGTA